MARLFVARWHHLLFYPDWFRRVHQRPGKFLGELVRPGMIVADIGCGLGFYTVEMARMVGEKGRVIAVDFQSQMLRLTSRKANKAAVAECVQTVQCTRDNLIVSENVDFVLSMWVAHEVPDLDRFFRQIRCILKPTGRFLLAEPKCHVGRELYEAICNDAERAGLGKVSEPGIGGSWAALFVALSK